MASAAVDGVVARTGVHGVVAAARVDGVVARPGADVIVSSHASVGDRVAAAASADDQSLDARQGDAVDRLGLGGVVVEHDAAGRARPVGIKGVGAALSVVAGMNAT